MEVQHTTIISNLWMFQILSKVINYSCRFKQVEIIKHYSFLARFGQYDHVECNQLVIGSGTHILDARKHNFS